MGAICTLLENKIAAKRSGTSNPAQWFIDWVGGGTASSSGLRVTEQSAMKFTPFWSAVRIISGTLAALPFLVYSRLDNGGKDRQPDHPVYRLLHDRPNDYMDAVTFFETRQAHALTYGNGYAEIQRDGVGRPIALWPLLPDRTQRKIKNGIPYYEVTSATGGETVFLSDYNVLHLKGLGFDGLTGYNVVHYHKEAIGYGQAVKEYGSRFFANDASPGGVLEHPESLGDKAFDHLKKSWLDQHKGLTGAHRIQILEEGMKYNKIGVDPKQAQSLEVQKWSVDDVSRIFQIPPHKLGSMEFSKYNNVEQLQLDFVATTMIYWFRKWEQECDFKLFMPSEQGKLFVEFLVDALLRGDIKSRYEAYSKGRLGGWLSVDDILVKENMNPLPDGQGQIYLEPMNMQEAGSGDTNGDDIRTALRGLIASQWAKVIIKQNKAKTTNGDFWAGHRKWSSTVLADSVNTWAIVCRTSPQEAKTELDRFISVNLHKDINFELSDAENLADLTMKRIGGNHA